MAEESDSLARLTFNAAATREVFADEAKGLRLRIERGHVAFRSAMARRGADVIAIERRARGVTVPVDQEHRQLLQRLFRAGLSEDKPFFTLEPLPRGWFGIAHYPEAEHPPRQPILTVSGFQPPPTAIDMIIWRRFQRIIASDRPIDDPLWQDIRKMVLGAITMTSRPARGRPSGDRLAAIRLLDIVKRNVAQFVDWGNRQPEFGDEISDMLARVGVNYADQVPVQPRRPVARTEEPSPVTEEQVSSRPVTEEQVPSRPMAQTEEPVSITRDYVAQVVTEAQQEQDEVDKPRRPRRKRATPHLAPVMLDDSEPATEENTSGHVTENIEVDEFLTHDAGEAEEDWGNVSDDTVTETSQPDEGGEQNVQEADHRIDDPQWRDQPEVEAELIHSLDEGEGEVEAEETETESVEGGEVSEEVEPEEVSEEVEPEETEPVDQGGTVEDDSSRSEHPDKPTEHDPD